MIWRALVRALGVGRRQDQRKVPILGVEGSGKSSLIFSLGQYVSVAQMGRVALDSSQLFADYLSFVSKGLPLPPTMRYEKFSIHVTRIPEPEGGFRHLDLVLSSEDIPGQDFRILVDELRRNPNLSTWGTGRATEVLKRFSQLLSDCAGFIFVIDLVRGMSAEEFFQQAEENVWAALADQIKPIMTGILLAAKMNHDLEHKPVFFVFSKPDLHRLPPARIREHFERGMAIPLAQLRGELVNVRHYNVQCAGWQIDSNLEDLGMGHLLADIAHAVGAVR